MSNQGRNRQTGAEQRPDGKPAVVERLRAVRARLVAPLALVTILSAIALNTAIAIRQSQEQRHALEQQHAVESIKKNLDELQNALLDEHEQLYTVIGTRPFYRRAPTSIRFPRSSTTPARRSRPAKAARAASPCWTS